MKTFSTNQVAVALGMAPKNVREKASRENWAFKVNGRSLQWVLESMPSDTASKVLCFNGSKSLYVTANNSTAKENSAFKQVSEGAREKAKLRAALIAAFESTGLNKEDFIQAYNAGLTAKTVFAKLGEVHIKTFYRWYKDFKDSGASALVPRYGLVPKGNGTTLSDIAKGYLEYFYLNQAQPSARSSWLLLQNVIPNVPSYPTALRYIQSLPKPYVDFHRLGKTKFDSLYQPFIVRDPSEYAPLEQVVSDHHCFDFVVTKNGRIFRPWVTIFQDFRSKKILGFCPSISPSGMSISIALYLAISQYGAFDMLHIDNGKDYRADMFTGKKVKPKKTDGVLDDEQIVYITGALEILGIKVTFSKPYHGQSKGGTERTFGTFAGLFSKRNPNYVGSNTVSRPEESNLLWRAINKQAKKEVLYTYDQYTEDLGAFINYWNANWSHSGKGMEGKSPDQVFAENPYIKKEVDHDTLALALTKAEVRKVSENGVKIDNIFFWSEKLFEYSGREVIVRRLLGRDDEALITDAKGTVICRAQADYFAESENLKDDIQRVEKARKENLKALTAMGNGKIEPPVGTRDFVEIAYTKMMQPKQPQLAKAVGAEDYQLPVQPTKLRRLKSPLDVTQEE